MLNRVLVLLGLVSFSIPTILNADDVTPVVPVVRPVSGGDPMMILSGGGAGAYEFVKLDKGRLQEAFFEAVFKRQETDYNYFLKTVNEIEFEFLKLLKDNVYGDQGLKTMSDSHVLASNPSFVTSDEFLLSVRRFKEQELALQMRIMTLTSIAKGALPSKDAVKADGSGLSELPQFGQQRFGDVESFYNKKIEEIENFVKNLPQNIMFNDLPHRIAANSGKGLVLEVQGAQLSIPKIKELRAQVVELRTWDLAAKESINAYTRYLAIAIKKFVDTYGTSEQYRIMNDANKAQMERDAKLIADAFWTRSYFRTAYGVPIGAIGIPYEKKWAHFEALTLATASLHELMEQPVWDEMTFSRIEQNYRNALRRADVRSEKILDGNLGILATGENLLTFLGGKRNEAEASQVMLQILAADVYEERLILAGDLMTMRQHYQKRYQSTDDEIVYYTRLRFTFDPNSYDPETTPQRLNERFPDRKDLVEKILAGKGSAFDQGTGLGSGENVKSHVANVMVHMDTQNDKLRQAQILEAQIANATDPNNKFSKQTKDRKGDL